MSILISYTNEVSRFSYRIEIRGSVRESRGVHRLSRTGTQKLKKKKVDLKDEVVIRFSTSQKIELTVETDLG